MGVAVALFRPSMTLDCAKPVRRIDPVDVLRGGWIDRGVLTAGLWLCLGLVIAAAFGLYRDASPPFDGAGRLLGLDFSALWAAGAAGLAGDWVASYDFAAFMAHMRHLFGDKAAGLLWAYPPLFYFVVAPLAMLPYGAALTVWLSATFAGFALAVRSILTGKGGLVWLAILAFPGVFGNAIHGQSGFLTAALFAGALVLLPSRPVLAGALFACLAYKPQYGLLIPLALAVGGYWRAFAAAAVFGLALLAASVLAFGADSWAGFFSGLQEMRAQALDRGGNGYHNMQSAFAAARLYDLPAPVAWTAQAIAALTVTAGTVWLWASRADHRLKAIALITGALTLTPYVLDYDLVLLGPAIAFFVSYGLERGFRPWEHSLLACAFVLPPLARYFAFFLHLPVGMLAVLGLFCLAVSRARHDLRNDP